MMRLALSPSSLAQAAWQARRPLAGTAPAPVAAAFCRPDRATLEASWQGWLESSLALRRGLQVQELLPAAGGARPPQAPFIGAGHA